jgi:hypothetical protein
MLTCPSPWKLAEGAPKVGRFVEEGRCCRHLEIVFKGLK